MHTLKSLSFIATIAILTSCSDSNTTPKSQTPEAANTAEQSQAIKLTASSQYDQFGPDGLMTAAQPGWHAEYPPKYPESLTVDLRSSREIKSLGLLPQDGHDTRAPKALRIEISSDGNSWQPVAESDNACPRKTPDGWSNINFPKPAMGRYVKLTIFSNCGDKELLTLRGLRFG